MFSKKELIGGILGAIGWLGIIIFTANTSWQAMLSLLMIIASNNYSIK